MTQISLLARSCLAGLLLGSAAPLARAALLRPMTELSSPVVRLSDLFDDAGERAGEALGPSPPPGQSITVEAPQLAAIAREFGVDWQPASPGDRAILARRATALSRAAVLAVLREGLRDSGAMPDDADRRGCELDVADFDPPLVAPEAHARPSLEHVDFDAASGRFSATILVEGEAMAPLHLRLGGTVQQTETILVAARRIGVGEIVTEAALRPARVRVGAWSSAAVAHGAADAVGLQARHVLVAGQPIRLDALAPPVLVARGGRVEVTLAAPGMRLTATGIALQAGALGTSIRVLNPVSRAVLLAEVVGPGAVQVAPDSLPLTPAQGVQPPSGGTGSDSWHDNSWHDTGGDGTGEELP